MKIKRFEAADMRSALREVQADLGPEAVILSTQTEAAGVCVIAALDYDAALLGPSREGPPETAKPASRAADTAWPAAAAPAPAAAPASAAPQSRPESRSESAPTRASEPAPSSAASAPRHGAATAAAFAPTATSPAAHASIFDEQRIAGLERELAAVHRLLAERLPAKLGKQLGQGPQKPTLLREIGLEEALITRLRAHCPEGSGNPDGRMLAELSRRLDALARPQTPRCLALVGPTGAGKTTTAAKLAAQHLMAHRGSRVRLICTDTYRIGGREQLQSYARLMGLSVELADDPEHLAACVAETGPQDLLLVDTPGIGPRDAELAQQHYPRTGHVQRQAQQRDHQQDCREGGEVQRPQRVNHRQQDRDRQRDVEGEQQVQRHRGQWHHHHSDDQQQQQRRAEVAAGQALPQGLGGAGAQGSSRGHRGGSEWQCVRRKLQVRYRGRSRDQYRR